VAEPARAASVTGTTLRLCSTGASWPPCEHGREQSPIASSAPHSRLKKAGHRTIPFCPLQQTRPQNA
jgi:hypothetical protein